jgi:peptidyl-prolyl cis-trans isomerase D
MLKTMRKNVKSLSPILWIVIATFIVAIFAVWGGAGRIGESSGSNVIATVGGDKITTDTFTQVLRQRIEALKNQVKEVNQGLIQQLNLPQRVLEEMIQQDLLLEMGREMGLSASDQELRDRITSYPSFQRNGTFIGVEEYKQLLNWNHINVAEFEQEMRQDIIISKVVRVLTANLAVTPEQAWENYRKTNETAKIEYLVLERDKVKLEGEPTPAEVQAYFDKNKDKFKIPEERAGLYVFLRTDDLKKEVELSEAEIAKYYNDNLDQFKVPGETEVSRIFLPLEKKAKDMVLAEARSLLDRLAKGEDFADLAKKYSKDAKAASGGAYGATDWLGLPANEQEEIRKLAAGQVSQPIELADGVALDKVTKKTEETTTPLAEAKTRIRTMLEEQKAQALAAERIGRLEKEARKAKSLETAATQSGFKVEKTGLLRKGGALGAIDPSGVISNALFGLSDKDISAALYTYRGAGLAQLESVAPAHEAKLDEVREEVLQDLEQSRKKEKAQQTLQDIRAKMTPKTSWEDVAKKDGLEIKTLEAHKRGEYMGTIGENADVDQLAFSLPLNEVSEPIEFANGSILLRVLSRKEVSRADFAKEEPKEMDSLLAEEGNKVLTSYLNKLREEKGVKIDYKTFLRVQQDILSRFTE